MRDGVDGFERLDADLSVYFGGLQIGMAWMNRTSAPFSSISVAVLWRNM
jgi:hypothetical protein